MPGAPREDIFDPVVVGNCTAELLAGSNSGRFYRESGSHPMLANRLLLYLRTRRAARPETMK